jgi:hypothetical protein
MQFFWSVLDSGFSSRCACPWPPSAFFVTLQPVLSAHLPYLSQEMSECYSAL